MFILCGRSIRRSWCRKPGLKIKLIVTVVIHAIADSDFLFFYFFDKPVNTKKVWLCWTGFIMHPTEIKPIRGGLKQTRQSDTGSTEALYTREASVMLGQIWVESTIKRAQLKNTMTAWCQLWTRMSLVHPKGHSSLSLSARQMPSPLHMIGVFLSSVSGFVMLH